METKYRQTKSKGRVELPATVDEILTESSINMSNKQQEVTIKLEPETEAISLVKVEMVAEDTMEIDPLNFGNSNTCVIKEEPCDIGFLDLQSNENDVSNDPLVIKAENIRKRILVNNEQKAVNNDIASEAKTGIPSNKAKDNDIKGMKTSQIRSTQDNKTPHLEKNTRKAEEPKIVERRQTRSTAQDAAQEVHRRIKNEQAAQQQRDRRANESPARRAARQHKMRIALIKKRLIEKLSMDQEELDRERAKRNKARRLLRLKKQQTETTEETAASKLRRAQNKQISVNRISIIETPEEFAARRAIRSERLKKRRHELMAKETETERVARKEREMQYRENHKQREMIRKHERLQQLQYPQTNINTM